MRQIVLDTETTGLSPTQGHRIIEIGCVELINRRLTGKTFHTYIQPEREIDAGAIAVHGITNEFLMDKPKFIEIAEEFKQFIIGAELIIHNAPFDVGFIESEFVRLKDKKWKKLISHCQITDSLLIARKKHPGQRNNLDALCKRYSINNQHRDKHGALLDAEILSLVYLAMTGGQNTLTLEDHHTISESENNETVSSQVLNLSILTTLPILAASQEELAEHQIFLANIEKKSGSKPIWEEVDSMQIAN